jgi:DNA polymerase II small subunit
MSQDILKIFIEKGFLLDNEMLNFLQELSDEEVAYEIIDKISIVSKKKVITKELVNDNLDKIKPIFLNLNKEKKKIIEKYFVNISISFEVKKETVVEDSVEQPKTEWKHKNSVKIISSPVLQSQKLEVKNFVKHFRNRYVFLKNILQRKTDLENLSSIDKLSVNNRNISIIGIVNSKKVTVNKNIIMEVEDLTGMVKLLIKPDNKEIFEKSKEILLDDVIGFKCSGSRDFLYVNDFFYPDSFLKEKHKTGDEAYALFISDIHVGSGNFLERNFNKFLDWLNGKDCDEKQKETLQKIRYMFVVGDSVDGVGVYPGQEKDLAIKDIKEQYSLLAEFYKRIPKHISIIQCAGQHDAVRVAEPQPPIGEDFAAPLYEIENLFLVSNPSLVEIGGSEEKEGLRVFMYHGASMHGVINEIEELRLNNAHKTPSRVVKHLLLRRHLAPSHGSAIYIPSDVEDSMLIKEVPDIITTGDLHRTDIDAYNNTLIICNSCWQSMTAFEEKVGNEPDPCKVPIVNLNTREVRILDFSDEEEIESNIDGSDIKIEVIENDAS